MARALLKPLQINLLTLFVLVGVATAAYLLFRSGLVLETAYSAIALIGFAQLFILVWAIWRGVDQPSFASKQTTTLWIASAYPLIALDAVKLLQAPPWAWIAAIPAGYVLALFGVYVFLFLIRIQVDARNWLSQRMRARYIKS